MEAVDQARYFRAAGSRLLNRGLLMAARETFQQWLEVATATGRAEEIITPLNALASVDIARKEYALALEWLTRAEVLAETFADAPAVSLGLVTRVHANLLVVYGGQRAQVEAEREAAWLEDAVKRLNDGNIATHTWYSLSTFYGLTNQHAKALMAAKAGLEADPVSSRARVRCQLHLGVAQAHLGLYPQATESLQLAIEQLTAEGAVATTAYAHTELGWIAYRQGRYQVALQEGEAALLLVLRQGSAVDKPEVARVSWLFGSVFAALGERNAALKCLNRAAAYFSQADALVEWEGASQAIGDLLHRPHRPSRRDVVPWALLKQLDHLTGMLDLIDDLESVAPHLRGHSERVGLLALELGQAAGLVEAELNDLYRAALLHDVGQVTIDSAVLQKSSSDLMPHEREWRQRHPELGAQMLAPFGFAPSVAQAVLHHHEHFDGSGYPRGLSGEEIPIMSGIIAIAEMYDAILSRQTPPPTHAQALAAVLERAGEALDPRLCELFAQMFNVAAT